jgi:hypothetical protein
MLIATESEQEFQAQTVSILNGKPVHLDGLADAIRTARMRIDAGGEEEAALPTRETSQAYNQGGQTDCLAEGIREARNG